MEKIKAGIVSLGLIGSSILKGLNEDYETFCYSTSCPKGAFRYTKNVSSNLETLSCCDIVFVCSPISKTLSMLERLNGIVRKDCVVCDCASVKSELLDKKFDYDFILSHPMAGSEKSGFEAGWGDLFKGAKWLVEKNNPILDKIISDLGALEVVVDMKKHDYMCAKISHMPAILASLLFNSTPDCAKQIASSGFRDMTRLAMSDLTLISDMMKYNEENILIAFRELQEEIESLKKLSDSEKMDLFKRSGEKRAQMYDENGKNIFKI